MGSSSLLPGQVSRATTGGLVENDILTLIHRIQLDGADLRTSTTSKNGRLLPRMDGVRIFAGRH